VKYVVILRYALYWLAGIFDTGGIFRMVRKLAPAPNRISLYRFVRCPPEYSFPLPAELY